jgi:hypothetical protein
MVLRLRKYPCSFREAPASSPYALIRNVLNCGKRGIHAVKTVCYTLNLNFSKPSYTYMLKEDVERFNEWWFTGKVRSGLAPPFKRYAFQRIVDRKRKGYREILKINRIH